MAGRHALGRVGRGIRAEVALMIITIEELLDATSGQVRFRCGSRSAKGYWRGTGEAPVGVGLDVEIELSEEEIISCSPASRSSRDPVRQEGDAIVLMGRVESVDADGIIVFRVGSGIVLRADRSACWSRCGHGSRATGVVGLRPGCDDVASILAHYGHPQRCERLIASRAPPARNQ